MTKTYTVVLFDVDLPKTAQYARKLQIERFLFEDLMKPFVDNALFDEVKYDIISKVEFHDVREFYSNSYVVIVGKKTKE